MNAVNLIKGLTIIQKYKPCDQSDYHVQPEHDYIYAGNTNWDIPPKEEKILQELGWEKDNDLERWVY